MWVKFVCKSVLNSMLKEQKKAFELNGLLNSKNKTEYMENKFKGSEQEVNGRSVMTINSDVIDEVNSLKYLGLFVQKKTKNLMST